MYICCSHSYVFFSSRKIAAISPAHDNYEETLSTLRCMNIFGKCSANHYIIYICLDANRAKNIKNKPHINEDPRDAQMRILQEEINRLKQELLDAGNMNREIQSFSSDGRVSLLVFTSLVANRVCSSISKASQG